MASPPWRSSTGSLIGAALLLLLPAAILVCGHRIRSRHEAWLAVVVMGIASTAIAYMLYFRLIANVGPAKAISVTYLIPGFAVVFGALFLDESLTLNMIIGCAVILAGTALATGLLRIFA